MAMTKLLFSESFDDSVGVGVTMIEDGRQLSKSASTIFGCDYSDMMPDKDHVGLHVIALGDMEHFFLNRNFDGFPKQACIDYHPTFVKHGQVYAHHRNKDRSKNMGSIVKSAYNEKMGRIELFIHAHKEKAADHLQKLASDGEVSVSMATTVPGDFCTICNQFRTGKNDPNQCEHIANELGKQYEDGTKVGMINRQPTFFDISFVTRPADRIAWSLKAASAGMLDSVKLAELEGIEEPDSVMILTPSAMRRHEIAVKLASIQSQLRTLVTSGARTAYEVAQLSLCKSAAASVSDATIEHLRKYEPADTFSALAKAGCVLNVTDFYRYALGSAYAEVKALMPSVQAKVASVFTDMATRQATWKACNETLFNGRNFPDNVVVIPSDVTEYPYSQEASLKLASASVSGAVKFAIDTTPEKVNLAVDTSAEKVSNDTSLAGYLAEKYAAYKLAALDTMVGDTSNHQVLWFAAAQDAVVANAT